MKFFTTYLALIAVLVLGFSVFPPKESIAEVTPKKIDGLKEKSKSTNAFEKFLNKNAKVLKVAEEKKQEVLENALETVQELKKENKGLKSNVRVVEKVIEVILDSAYVMIPEYNIKMKGLSKLAKYEVDTIYVKKKVKIEKE